MTCNRVIHNVEYYMTAVVDVYTIWPYGYIHITRIYLALQQTFCHFLG